MALPLACCHGSLPSVQQPFYSHTHKNLTLLQSPVNLPFQLIICIFQYSVFFFPEYSSSSVPHKRSAELPSFLGAIPWVL